MVWSVLECVGEQRKLAARHPAHIASGWGFDRFMLRVVGTRGSADR